MGGRLDSGLLRVGLLKARCQFAAALALAALGSERAAMAEEGVTYSDPILTSPPCPPLPASQIHTFRPHRAMFIVGFISFAGAYWNAIMAGTFSSRDADRRLFVPLAGPWLDLGSRGCGADPCGKIEAIRVGLLVVNGLSQGLGLAAGISSFFVTERVTSRASLARPTVAFSPLAGPGAVGVAAHGAF